MKNAMIFPIALVLMMQVHAQTMRTYDGHNGSITSSLPKQVFKGQWLKVNLLLENNESGSQVYMMLSDEKGMFQKDSDRNVLFHWTVSGNDLSARFNVTIPERVAAGEQYRMRIVSRAPDGKVSVWEEGVELKDMITWYVDEDGDGLGDPGKSFVSTKDVMDGCVRNGSDTNDSEVQANK